MLTQNFGAAANFQSFGVVPQRTQPDHACQCGTPTPGYPQPGGYQQPQASGQMQMQMIMSYFMNMMSSMMQLQQGFGSYLGGGQQQPHIPFSPMPNGGYNGGGGYPVGGGGYPVGGGYNGGGGYPVGGGYPQPAPFPAPGPAPAPQPPAKKGGYA